MFDPIGQTREDESRQALLGRILAEAMDDAVNIAAYRAAVESYPATTLLCAYMTAKSVPPKFIGRSRGAYFIFLLQKLWPHPSRGASLPSHPAGAPQELPSSES